MTNKSIKLNKRQIEKKMIFYIIFDIKWVPN
jgi:hypothetical protein